MDSDCDIAANTLEKVVQIFFLSDPTIGAVTGHARVRSAQGGSILDPGYMA
jgi:hypothetical protein